MAKVNFSTVKLNTEIRNCSVNYGINYIASVNINYNISVC